MKKKMEIDKKKLPRIITTTLATCFIILGTFTLVLYSRGYRINNQLGNVQKTGVLNVESEPIRATLIVDGEEVGRTPKTISSLVEGFHMIEVQKEKYHPWNSRVEIVAEKSTPIYPHLFPINPEFEEVFSIDAQLVDKRRVPDSNYIFITTTKTVEPDPITGAEVSFNRIWRYNTNPSFWNTSQNPSLVYEADIASLKSFQTDYSNSGEYALLYVTTNDPTYAGDKTEVFLLDTSNHTNTPRNLSLSDYVGEYEISWAEDDSYLVLESKNELISFDISSEAKTLLLRKDKETVWTTDSDDNFYYLEQISDTENNMGYMQIVHTPLSGGSPEIAIDKIYYSETDEYLITQEELLAKEEPYTFNNSPNASQFAGMITDFTILPEINAIYIKSEYAAYLYDLETNMYTLLSSKPGEFVFLSPDEMKFLYTVDDSLYLYTFDKESADHTAQIGISSLPTEGKPQNIHWHKDSMLIVYSDGQSLKTIDIHGENTLSIMELNDNFFVLDQSGESIFTINTEKIPNLLERVKIN